MRRPFHNPDRAPGIEPEDLLALVEDPTLAHRPDLAQALQRDPRVRAMVEGMQRDRQALRSLPAEAPPEDLIDRVTVRLIEGRGQHGGIPRSRVPAPAVGTFRLRWPLRPHHVAMAAGLALLLTGGALVWRIIAQDAATTERFALRSPSPEEGTASGESGAGALRPHEQSGGPPTPTESTVALARRTAPAGVTGADQAPVEAPPAASADQRAVDLALEGRLVIRVSTEQPVQVTDVLDRLARDPDRRAPWRIAQNPPEGVVAAVRALLPEEIRARDIAFAGPEPDLPRIDVGPVPERNYVYGAQAPAGRETLGALLRSLSVGGAEVALIESPSPLVPATPPVHPDAVLWWTADPSSWRRWVEIPIVVTPR